MPHSFLSPHCLFSAKFIFTRNADGSFVRFYTRNFPNKILCRLQIFPRLYTIEPATTFRINQKVTEAKMNQVKGDPSCILHTCLENCLRIAFQFRTHVRFGSDGEYGWSSVKRKTTDILTVSETMSPLFN